MRLEGLSANVDGVTGGFLQNCHRSLPVRSMKIRRL